MEIVKEIKIDSIEDLFNNFLLHGKYSDISKRCIFRGQSDSKYELLPSLLRKNTIDLLVKNNDFLLKYRSEYNLIRAEYQLLSNFYRTSNKNGMYVPYNCRIKDSLNSNMDIELFLKTYVEEKWLPKDLYEIASLAQHYGLPTRLLDWTTNWKTALYFASESVIRKSLELESQFVLWAIDINMVNGFNFINGDFPLKLIRPIYADNKNLKAQSGLFTLWEIDKPFRNIAAVSKLEADNEVKELIKGIETTPLDKLLENKLRMTNCKTNEDKPIIYKFTINNSIAKSVFSQLYYDGVNGASLFPSYDGVKRAVEELNFLENDERFRL